VRVLRIPTGGGKTLLASHAIVRVAKEWMDSDAPTALWLTPSETIRSQTISALQTPGHPYRAALEAPMDNASKYAIWRASPRCRRRISGGMQ